MRGAILLTLSALLGLGTMVYFIMYFTTGSLHLPTAYWLVPLFGAIGGAVGGVRENKNKLVLSVVEKPDRINLGVVGDICVGLGGACAIVFLFGNTLKIDLEASASDNARSTVLLISVSFLAGVFGNKVIEKAGREFMSELEDVKQETAKLDATLHAVAARELIRNGEFQQALELCDLALKIEPKNIRSHIAKAAALKRLGKVELALATIDEALSLRPNEVAKADCLYNRACYMSILKMSSTEILTDIKEAFKIFPEIKKDARTDKDLEWMRSVPEFNKLITEGEGST